MRDHPLGSAFDALYSACIWIAGAAIVLMSIIVPVGVVLRYVFGFGAQWPEPIAILLMVIFTFIGAAAAYRAGGHIAVTMLTDRLPESLRAASDRLVHVLMLLVCTFVASYGTKLCAETMRQSVAELPWLPVGVTYIAIPLGAAATLAFVVEHLVWGLQSQREIVRFGEAS